jgi:hypothetical protein
MPNNKVGLLGAAIIAVAGVAASAAAETTWQKNHPRQHAVLKGANVQTGRTHHALRAGQLTGNQAQKLNRENRAIKSEDRRDAKINGGFISKGQKNHMIQQQSGIRKQRRHDEKVNASAK